MLIGLTGVKKLSHENTDDISLNIWDNTEEKKGSFAPFVNWEFGVVILKLDKSIKEYIPKTISGNFGAGHYIEIDVGIDEDVFESQMLKIDSVRMRKALVELNIKSYPAIVELIRLGNGYQTSYKANLLELVKQQVLTPKKK